MVLIVAKMLKDCVKVNDVRIFGAAGSSPQGPLQLAGYQYDREECSRGQLDV